MPVLGSGLSAFRVVAASGSHLTDILPQPWLAAAGAVCAIAAIVWARAAARLARAAPRIAAAPRVWADARLPDQRSRLERRAEEVLAQEDLAPRRWAARLAPETLPTYDGFDIGWVYEPGTGMMAGDFYDVFPTSPDRLAVVIGDVAGHGIEASITAFQVKHVLRIFLRQYRDPAQALEELNKTL